MINTSHNPSKFVIIHPGISSWYTLPLLDLINKGSAWPPHRSHAWHQHSPNLSCFRLSPVFFSSSPSLFLPLFFSILRSSFLPLSFSHFILPPLSAYPLLLLSVVVANLMIPSFRLSSFIRQVPLYIPPFHSKATRKQAISRKVRRSHSLLYSRCHIISITLDNLRLEDGSGIYSRWSVSWVTYMASS